MSSDIWMQCEGKSKIQLLSGRGYRVVEDQAHSSTLKIVETQEEHDLLEDILEKESKPKLSNDLQEFHYLLFTPFRYPPLKYGSRFGTIDERGIFYGSESIRTSLSEKAFYLFYFMSGSTAKFEPSNIWFTVFSFDYSSNLGIDLTASFFKNHEAEISHPLNYSKSQKLGSKMRVEGVEAFLFRSARDPKKGKNIGIFSPNVFKKKQVGDADKSQWNSTININRIFFEREDENYNFKRDDFLVSGTFPNAFL